MEKKILKLFPVNLNAVFSNIILLSLKVNTTSNRRASLAAQAVKNLPASAGDWGSIPGPGRSPETGWLPTPVFLPRKFHGHRSLVGYSSSGHKESDTTDQLTLTFTFQPKIKYNNKTQNMNRN